MLHVVSRRGSLAGPCDPTAAVAARRCTLCGIYSIGAPKRRVAEVALPYRQHRGSGSVITAAVGPNPVAMGYHECFIRDLVPRAHVLLLGGRCDIVHNLRTAVMTLRGLQPVPAGHKRSMGLSRPALAWAMRRMAPAGAGFRGNGRPRSLAPVRHLDLIKDHARADPASYSSISTRVPAVIRSYRSTMSALRMRIQPWERGTPIGSSSGVPWM